MIDAQAIPATAQSTLSKASSSNLNAPAKSASFDDKVNAYPSAQNDIAPSQNVAYGNNNNQGSVIATDSIASTIASVDKPVVNLNVAVNSLDALMSAVSNLNAIMDPRAKIAKKSQDQEQKNSIAASLVVTAEPASKDQNLLPDSILPLAKRVFDYVDALRAHESLFDNETQNEDKDSVNAQLIEARTKARTVVSQAVSMGVAERDYIPTDVEVQSDAGDEFDPFAGGSSATLHVVDDGPYNAIANTNAENKVENSADNIKVAPQADTSLNSNEVLAIVGAVQDDIKKHSEDESVGEREKPIENIQPQATSALNADSNLTEGSTSLSVAPADHVQENTAVSQNSIETAPKDTDTLYADGVALSADLVEGQREGESVADMLRRVQETALAQLRQDDAINGPNAKKPDDATVTNINSNEVVVAQTPAPTVTEPHNNTDLAETNEDKLSFGEPNESKATHLDAISLQEPQAPTNTKAIDNKELTTAPDVAIKHSDNKLEVVLLDDPFENENAFHAQELNEGKSLTDALAQIKDKNVCISTPAPKDDVDVVGELLRSELLKLDGYATNKNAPISNSPASLNTATAPVKALSPDADATNLASINNDASEQILSDPEPIADLEPDDEEDDTFDDHMPPPASFHDFDERDAQFDASVATGIQVLPDGRMDDVPIAERMERERIENADKIAQGRALEPDDFIAQVVGSDPWGIDFVAAGYSEGAVFSALCASVRCIDPTDPNHWIVVMSDSFKIFAIDPNFVQGLMERFSSLKKHHIEISIQLSQGFPQGSPRDLCVKAFGAASDRARHDLASDPAVQQIAQLAGADLRYCAVKLFALS